MAYWELWTYEIISTKAQQIIDAATNGKLLKEENLDMANEEKETDTYRLFRYDAGNIAGRYKNLNKTFEICSSIQQAQNLAMRDYTQFKNDYFADKKFYSGVGRYLPQKVFQRVNTRDLIKDLTTAKFEWSENTDGGREEV